MEERTRETAAWGGCDLTLLTLKEEEWAVSKECGRLLGAVKGEGMDPPWESAEGIPVWQHLDFSLLRPISDFWLLELWDGKKKISVVLNHDVYGIDNLHQQL